MTANNDISDRMARIRSIFEDAQQAADSHAADEALIAYLDTIDLQFRSVAYEGASMSRALADISNNDDSLQHWTAYAHRTHHHAVHVYIGLGWALSQRQVPALSFIQNLSPIMQARVLDGCGYYDGMFRNRSSVRDKTIPERIKGNDLRAYDQGLGRSLWYVAKGNITQLLKLIESFPDSRKPNLWRGIGIAVSYVGACDKSTLNSLFASASPYQIPLASGAVLLARARAQAGTQNSDADLTCRLWCRLSADQAVSLMDRTEPTSTSGDTYIKWVSSIEREISKSV